MPSEIAITRLLYAMLSQKNLKDIDWNLVAQDPVLSKEITNGHAARMRYSRFKKQMEGTPTISRRPRGPRKERAMRVEKKPRIKKENALSNNNMNDSATEEEGPRRIKQESGLYSASTSASISAHSTPAPQSHHRIMSTTSTPTPSSTPGPTSTSLPLIKREPGTSNSHSTPHTPIYPSTPLSMTSSLPLHSRTHSPAPSFTYHSPPNMDEVIYGKGMSPYNLSMSPSPSASHLGIEHNSGAVGRLDERRQRDHRSLYQQSMIANRVLGPQQVLEIGMVAEPFLGLWGEHEHEDVGGQNAERVGENGMGKGMGKEVDIEIEREKGMRKEGEGVQVKLEKRWEEEYGRNE